MIRINKTANIPQILSSAGIAETTNLINAYNTNSAQYTSSTGVSTAQIVKMDFDNRIYGHKSIKDQLISEQHEKCCFCEAKFSDNSFGDVEHFRPKKAYKKQGSNVLTYPGYYWLAYDWYNLMYSCEKCNRKHKRSDFPLDNETTRKPHHNHPNLLVNEDRLLINPIEEDPSLFITFMEEVPVPVNNSKKGSASIKAYGLERLNESRLEHLQAVKTVLILSSIDETNPTDVVNIATAFKVKTFDLVELIQKSKQLFNSVAKDTSKFTNCIRCKFPHLPTV